MKDLQNMEFLGGRAVSLRTKKLKKKVKKKINKRRGGIQMERKVKQGIEWKMHTHFQVRNNYSGFLEALVLAFIIT